MAKINLLPWREELRKEREKHFYIMAGVAAAISLLIIAYIHMMISGSINHQERRNQFLSQQINKVNKEIEEIKSLEVEKARLMNRMKVIQDLQTSRPEVVHLFEELVTTLPDGAQLLKVENKEDHLQIEAVADSNALISSFMRNIDASPWLANPELIVIDTSTRDYPGASWFSIKVNRKSEVQQPTEESK